MEYNRAAHGAVILIRVFPIQIKHRIVWQRTRIRDECARPPLTATPFQLLFNRAERTDRQELPVWRFLPINLAQLTLNRIAEQRHRPCVETPQGVDVSCAK
jgi:hypothetical protein